MKEALPESGEIVYSSRYEELALKKSDGTIITFNALSDGYRNVIKLITDIAVRMCILNPYLKDRALIETPGIVMIDEIDLSLHPNWQRSIIGLLKSIFPKVQFMCTTHSPFIIQSLDRGELINLDSSDGVQYSGESIEDIASEVMNVDDVKWSKSKQELHDKALEYFEALKKLNADDFEGQKELSEKLELARSM
jgi:predicted ATP-binding protein involved in virulence